MALRFAAKELFQKDAGLRVCHRMACWALLGLGFFVLPASATIKCVDAKGKTVYQDMPCVAGTRVTPIQGERNTQGNENTRPPTVAELKEQAEALLLKREAVAQKVNACELRREAEVRRQIMRHDAGDMRTADDRTRLNGILAECQTLTHQQTALIKKSVAGSRGLEGGSAQASNPTEAGMVPVAACLRELGEELSRQIMRHDAGDMRTADDRTRLNGILAECQTLTHQQTALIKKSVAGSRGLEGGSAQASNPTEAGMVPVAACLRELGEELSRQYALKTDASGDLRNTSDRRRLISMQNSCDVNGSPSAATPASAPVAATATASDGQAATAAAPANGAAAVPASGSAK